MGQGKSSKTPGTNRVIDWTHAGKADQEGGRHSDWYRTGSTERKVINSDNIQKQLDITDKENTRPDKRMDS